MCVLEVYSVVIEIVVVFVLLVLVAFVEHVAVVHSGQ
jgi:hypothetical protein